MNSERRLAFVESLMDALDAYVDCKIDVAADDERWPGSCSPARTRETLRAAIVDVIEELEQ